MRRLPALLTAIASLAVLASSCGKNNVTGPGGTNNVAGPGGMGTVHLALTDAPADYDSVVLVIREVSVHRAGPDDSGWSTIPLTESVFDLLRLRNGVFTNLGLGLVPAGHYTQVRLLLDSGSYVVVSGIRHDLKVPSGLQTGLKLTGEFDVPAGGAVDIGVDFDAARSIHVTGNGRYMMKPTARVQVIANMGAITGVVSPADPASALYAIAGLDTVASTISGSNGGFTLALLPPGTYSVAIDAPAGLVDTTLAGVGVNAGQATDVGTVTLRPQ